jgi:transposase
MTLEDAISEIHQLRQSLAERDHEIDKLQRLLKQAQKNLYGRKSEKLSKESTQEPLFTFQHEPEQQPLENVTEVPAHTRRTSKREKELPSDLPRERIEYDLEDKLCKGCGSEMSVIGEEKTEILEHVPAQFTVIEHVRLKRACGCCKTGVFTPKLPPTVQPLERAQPGPGLLAHIILSKYMDHLPLYRQEQMFARQRIELSRQKMCDWIASASELLFPLWQEQKREMLALPYLQADETTIKVQDHEEKDGGLHTGYFWTLHSPEKKLVSFEYYESRAGECAKELFAGFSGTAQTDYYAGYNKVLLPGTVRRLACLAHVRRKFIEAQSSGRSECGRVLELIAKLYHIENQSKGLAPPDRKAAREKHARDILQKLRAYLLELQTKTLPRAPLAEALSYALSQWDAIELYLEDGTFEIDNNGVERQIRPIAIGRKNYLFAGSHEGARRAAILYSLLATCKLHKINAFEWLRDVLVRVHDRNSKLKDLLPHRWTPANSLKHS